jgi:hypothetical protein
MILLTVFCNSFKIYYNTESWLNDSILSHNLFSDLYCVFHADRDSLNSNSRHGGRVIIAVSKSFQVVKQRYDLEATDDCVWVDIPIGDNYSLLTGKHYFATDCDVKLLKII